MQSYMFVASYIQNNWETSGFVMPDAYSAYLVSVAVYVKLTYWNNARCNDSVVCNAPSVCL